MLKYILMALLLAAPVQADQGIDLCTGYSDYAETVMEQRQAGVDIAIMMTAVPAEDQFRLLLLNIIELAYSMPRYQTDEYVKRSVQDFRNMVFLICYQANPDKAE